MEEFEKLIIKYDPMHARLVEAAKVTVDFISRKGYKIYGGTAIDFALRLKGGNIYPDDSLLVPDLDFYAPDSIDAAYELAEIFYDMGFAEARAIYANHVQTMRVDVGDNHFIADITFCPRETFDKIPTLSYNGMLITHPDYQRIDMHAAFCFPFNDPPMEVIFNRFKKDHSRLAILDRYYPIEEPEGKPTFGEETVIAAADTVFTGVSALAIFAKSCEVDIPGLPRVTVRDGKLVFDHKPDIVHADPQFPDPQKIERGVLDALPEVYHYEQFRVFSTKDKLVATCEVDVDGVTVMVTSVQFLLKIFMAISFLRDGPLAPLGGATPRVDPGYRWLYFALHSMVPKIKNDCVYSVRTYGHDNASDVWKMNMKRQLHNYDSSHPVVVTPTNYYVGRSNKVRPYVDYSIYSG